MVYSIGQGMIITLNMAAEKDVTFNQEEYNKDWDFIKTSRKSQIARDLWGNNGTYIVWLENDEQFLKGVSLFEESIKLAKLKQ